MSDRKHAFYEREGQRLTEKLLEHLEASDAVVEPRQIRTEDGKVIPLNFNADNPALAELFVEVLGVTHLSPAARVAIARLQAVGVQNEREATQLASK